MLHLEHAENIGLERKVMNVEEFIIVNLKVLTWSLTNRTIRTDSRNYSCDLQEMWTPVLMKLEFFKGDISSC